MLCVCGVVATGASGGPVSVCVLHWRCCATRAAWPLNHHAPHSPHRCSAVAATVSTITVKSASSFSPYRTSLLPPVCLPTRSGLQYRDIAIRIATIIDMDFWPRYNPYSDILLATDAGNMSPLVLLGSVCCLRHGRPQHPYSTTSDFVRPGRSSAVHYSASSAFAVIESARAD